MSPESPITVAAAMGHQPSIAESELMDGFNVKYLKLIGLWTVINHQRTTGKKNLVIRATVISIFPLTVPYILFQLISYFTVKIDLLKATFLTIHLLIALQIWCKLLMFWFRMDSICWLYDLAKKDFLAIPARKHPHVKQIFKKITKKTNTLCLITLLVNASLGSHLIFYPGVPVDYISRHTGSMLAVTSGKMKILGGWYPVPMDQSPYYECILIYEAVASFCAGTTLTVFICLFYQLLMCLYAQFTVLGYVLSTLKADAVESCRRSARDHASSETEMYKQLYSILQDHQKLLSYASELRRVYNPLVTMILGMGISMLVIDVFQFLSEGAGSPLLLFRSLQYLVYQGIEVCMFCFGSSSIEAASSDLQFAIYSSDWYKADVNFRKSAQMLMVRASRGVTLTAIKMYPVNVETIMAILQFTYSVTALMSRMSE